MPPKKNPLKLNKLQLRTLILAQLLAQDPSLARRDEATGLVTLLRIPHAQAITSTSAGSRSQQGRRVV